MNLPMRIGAPAAPGNNATVTLFDSTVTLLAGLHAHGVRFIIFDFAGLNQASAVAGLRGYKSPDGGVTWYESSFGDGGLPLQIAADTGTDGDVVKIYIGSCADVKFTFTAGATGPTVWSPVITLDTGIAAIT